MKIIYFVKSCFPIIILFMAQEILLMKMKTNPNTEFLIPNV